MTKKEEEVLKIIIKDPTIEQEKIAQILGIKRSTVAVHISSLIKQGKLLGKAYIINKNNYIVGIGASNIDIYGKAKINIKTHFDHPANISYVVGGVMHNIIANYALLDKNAKILTAVGDDDFGKIIINDYKKRGIDVSNVLVSKDNPSGVFMQVQDQDNDMYLALCDQNALNEINKEYLLEKQNIILASCMVVVDSSISEETLKDILKICKDKVKVYADPVSDNFAKVLRKYVKDIYCIKPNRSELKQLSGMNTDTLSQVKQAAKSLIDKGLKKIYVSMSCDGLLYMDQKQTIVRSLKKEKKMVNASGAGDALMGTLLYGENNKLQVEKIMDLALAAGSATVMCQDTICKDLSIDYLENIVKEKRK